MVSTVLNLFMAALYIYCVGLVDATFGKTVKARFWPWLSGERHGVPSSLPVVTYAGKCLNLKTLKVFRHSGIPHSQETVLP